MQTYKKLITEDKILIIKLKVDKLSPTFYKVAMEVVWKRGRDASVESSTRVAEESVKKIKN